MNQYDHIRKNLKDFQVPIDKDKLWANTAHAIPQKRRRRGAFFLLLGGALLISSAVTIYALTTLEKNNTTHAEIQAASNTTADTPASGTNNVTNRAMGESMVANASPVESTPEPVFNAKNITEKSNPQAFDAKKTSQPSRSNTTKSMVTSQHTEADVSNNSETQKDQLIPTETTGTASTDDPGVVVTETVSNQMSGAITLEPVILESAPELRIANLFTAEIPSLPVSELNILPREILTSNAPASRTKNKNRINLLLMQGFGWSTMKMVTDNPELQPTIDVWNNKMTSLENMSTSLQAGIRLPKGIQLGAGLQYSVLTTQMEYQQTLSEEYTEQGITEIIIDEQGNVQNLMGDVKIHRQSIIYSTRFTSHNRLDLEGIVSIPVIRNYRTETGIWVKVGYNILYDANGTTFGPGDVPVKFSAAENPFTLQSPFTFGAGIGTVYRLNPHWYLNARVGYERLRYTHGLYDDQISFHHSIFNLGLGVGYTF